LELLASFAESAKQALENAVKIFILVLLLMSLAFELLFIVILFGLFFILSISTFNRNEYSISLIDLTKLIIIDIINEHIFSLEYKIIWKYNEILDMELPESDINMCIDGIEFSKIRRFEIRNTTESNKNMTLKYSNYMEGRIAAEIIILTFLSLYVLMFYSASQYIIILPFLLIGILTILEIVITNLIAISINDNQSLDYISNLISFLFGLAYIFLLNGFLFSLILIGKEKLDIISILLFSLEIFGDISQAFLSWDYLDITWVILHTISWSIILFIDYILLRTKIGKNAIAYCAILLYSIIFMIFGLRLLIYCVSFFSIFGFLFLIQ